MGTFGRRPFKFESKEVVTVNVNIDIPRPEYDLLVSYARGLSLNVISIETNSDYKTIVSVLRRNMLKILDK